MIDAFSCLVANGSLLIKQFIHLESNRILGRVFLVGLACHSLYFAIILNLLKLTTCSYNHPQSADIDAIIFLVQPMFNINKSFKK